MDILPYIVVLYIHTLNSILCYIFSSVGKRFVDNLLTSVRREAPERRGRLVTPALTADHIPIRERRAFVRSPNQIGELSIQVLIIITYNTGTFFLREPSQNADSKFSLIPFLLYILFI